MIQTSVLKPIQTRIHQKSSNLLFNFIKLSAITFRYFKFTAYFQDVDSKMRLEYSKISSFYDTLRKSLILSLFEQIGFNNLLIY